MQRSLSTVLLVLTALGLLAGPASAGEPEHARLNRSFAQVRAATAAYHDVTAAEAAGYALASPCVPGMGLHYSRGVATTADELDPTDPEILVYAPRPDGSLALVAVEYASWEPTELFGMTFDPPHDGGPPYHTLHAWVWRPNPEGMFAPLNPRVTSCPPLEPLH